MPFSEKRLIRRLASATAARNPAPTALLAAAKSNENVVGGVAFTENVAYKLTPDQNQNIASGAVLRAVVTRGAVADPLTAAMFVTKFAYIV